jgi:TldD protein
MRYVGIAGHAGLFRGYTELRVQENRTASVAMVKGNLSRNINASSGGVSARVHRQGVWGFASDPRVSGESVAAVIDKAAGNAEFLAGKERRSRPPLPATAFSSSHDLSTRKPRLGQEALVDFVRGLDSSIAARYPKLMSRSIGLHCLDMEKTLLTSEGAEAYSLIPRTLLYVTLVLESQGEPVEVLEVYGGPGHFEEHFLDRRRLEADLDAQYGHLALKAEGVHPEAGVHDAILGPDLAGILAHEAIGHTVEGDLVLGGSVAEGKLGRTVASELVTLVDYANSALGQPCPVPVWTDDEGTEARDAVLIDRGVLRSYMHNKETAERLGQEPTGNARAFAFSDEPLVRMRNTAIVPGSSKLEDMIGDLEDGYYFLKPSNGQADSTSEFMFGVTLGYEVRKGRIERALKDTTISGVAFDMLKTVTAVSDDMAWDCSGFCGKKQPIPVGLGGAAVRCRVNVGGR